MDSYLLGGSQAQLAMAQSLLLSTGTRFHRLPESYIRPTSERPNLSEVVSEDVVPVIDLACQDKEIIIRQIGNACRSYGIFKVMNHGIAAESMHKMIAVAREFFHLPIEEKMRFYSDDPCKKMRLSTSFNVTKEKVHNWRDYLRLHCHPLEEFVHEWPSTPPSFK
ncbi:hypothetical protein ACLOJK_032086 [Asimina triloba]